MEHNNPEASKLQFFKTLRNGISTINKSVLEIENEMKTSKGSADKALTKLVNISAEVKNKKVSASQIKKDLEVANESNFQYFTHMESLIENMEGRLKNVTNRLKEFGYVPPSDTEETKILPETDLNQNNDNIDNANEIQNNKRVNDTENIVKNDMKTPICVNAKSYSNFTKNSVRGERLFAPAPKGYDASSPRSLNSNFGFGDLSTISGDHALANIENSSFNLKLNEIENNDGNSPQLLTMTSAKETRKAPMDEIITPEDPSISKIKKRITTPEFPLVTSHCNVTRGNRDTPEDPLVLHTNVIAKDVTGTPEDPLPINFNKAEVISPQTPKTPELTSKFRRS